MAQRHFLACCTVAIGALMAQPGLAQSDNPVEQGAPNVPQFKPYFPEQTRAPAMVSGIALQAQVLADGLEHPWGIAVLPSGGYLVTERSGELRMLAKDGTLSGPIGGVPKVLARRQGGLLDVTLDPEFSNNRLVYLTFSKPLPKGLSATAAARGRLSEDGTKLQDVQEIFVQTPGSPTPMHYGSRILFDNEGHAFITTGEHSSENERVFAQDLDKTYGKVIRLNKDGTIPDGNPFIAQSGAEPSIWSYGHRNIQGAAINPASGQLWTIEHGPRGGDELNKPEPGKNYGWPVISYGENYSGSPVGQGITQAPGMEQPRYYWDPVIAPGGMTFYQGDMFPDWKGDIIASSLRPGGLVRLKLDGDTVVGEERLLEDIGRVRDVQEAPDGALLVLIDAGNGKVLRVTPK
ncbi:MAG: PQQ-dependent sugar dehydrogenase [Stappiaceae bacterium]